MFWSSIGIFDNNGSECNFMSNSNGSSSSSWYIVTTGVTVFITVLSTISVVEAVRFWRRRHKEKKDDRCLIDDDNNTLVPQKQSHRSTTYINRDDLIMIRFMSEDKRLSAYAVSDQPQISKAFTIATIDRCGFYHDVDEMSEVIARIMQFKKTASMMESSDQKNRTMTKKNVDDSAGSRETRRRRTSANGAVRPWLIRKSSTDKFTKKAHQTNNISDSRLVLTIVSISYLDADMKTVRSNRFVQVTKYSSSSYSTDDKGQCYDYWYTAPLAVLERCVSSNTSLHPSNSRCHNFDVLRESPLLQRYDSLLLAVESVVLKQGLSFYDLVPIKGAQSIPQLLVFISP